MIWLANPPDAYREDWVGYLLFWSEISEDVAMGGAQYTPIEGPDETVSAKAWQNPWFSVCDLLAFARWLELSGCSDEAGLER